MRNGFTLIELMIVVAIIAVLVGVVTPIYQIYVARSQIMAAIGELQGAKSQYELIINNGSASGSSDFTVANMFFSDAQSEICIYAVNQPDGANISNQALVCELKNVASVLTGESVYLNRDADGAWTCSTSVGIEDKFKPAKCL